MSRKMDFEELDVRFDRHPGKPRSAGETGGLATSTSSPYPFAYARTALKYGLRARGFESGDEVLVPEFVCESLLEPMAQLGIRPVFYPAGAALAPDWPRLPPLLGSRTRALVVVHYFGQPQPLEDCMAFAAAHDLLLIEDNAHGHGAEHAGRRLGTFGQVGISAPRKSFPVENGACLYLDGDYRVDLADLSLPEPHRTPLKHRARRWMEALPGGPRVVARRARMREAARRAGPAPAYHSQDAFRDPPIPRDFGMSEVTQAFLAEQDLTAARNARQRIYDLWQGWALTMGLEPLFPHDATGSMPLVYPALARSTEESRRWFERGHRWGVDVHSWPTLPRSVVAQDGAAMRLWERLVCFPIHQAMDEEALKRRIQLL